MLAGPPWSGLKGLFDWPIRQIFSRNIPITYAHWSWMIANCHPRIVVDHMTHQYHTLAMNSRTPNPNTLSNSSWPWRDGKRPFQIWLSCVHWHRHHPSPPSKSYPFDAPYPPPSAPPSANPVQSSNQPPPGQRSICRSIRHNRAASPWPSLVSIGLSRGVSGVSGFGLLPLKSGSN